MSKLLSGRYELIEKIGEGGMAVVYKAKDRLLSRYVAIKILRPEFVKDAQFVDSFRKESQQAAALQHPNIISVYDVGQENNIYYIVMELVDGRPLSDIIKERAPMDYKEVIRISRQVASALSLAHKNNIIHRDIKPHNIMITEDGTAKLGDFGIAKAISDSTLTETSKVIGSVHYFSPEQARGQYVDERSDIYSLGIVMYEMLTGKVPFDGDNPVQVALMHINDEITPPSQLVSGIPPQLEKIVMKATDKFQSNRYRTADDMLNDLNNIDFVTNMVGNSVFAANQQDQQQTQKTEPEQTVQQTQTAAPTKKKKKKKIGRIIAIIAVLVACGLIAAYAIPKIMSSQSSSTKTVKKVTVPDVTEKTYESAKSELEDAGFVVERGEDVNSDTIDEGEVVSQDPEGNTKAKKGSTVTLTVSAGSETAEVPNLVGSYYSKETTTTLNNAGFNLGYVDYAKSDDYKKGQIISQDPTGGSTAAKDSNVDIVVCSGAKTVKYTVPSLTGLTEEEAVAKIESSHFTVGNITYEESSVYGEGYVMWQQYAAGRKLKKGTSISIKISKGSSDPSDSSSSDSSSSD